MAEQPTDQPPTQPSNNKPGKTADDDSRAGEGGSRAGEDTPARSAKVLAGLSEARAFVVESIGLARQTMLDRLWVNFRSFLDERQMLVWTLAAVIGASVGYASIVFRWLIGLIQWPWLYTTTENVAAAASAVPWWNILLAPTIGGLVVGYILQHYTKGRRAHGVADVIEARALHDSRIDPKIGLMSAGLSALSIGSGASVGREGPVVHIGATIAAFLDNRFNLSPSARRTLLACGAAAGVSASFNAPIAGVLFAHEIILTHYAFRALVPTVIASVLGAVVARIHLGNFPAFSIPDYQITSYWEFPAFALLGLTCAVVAILFQLALMGTERVSWRINMPLWLRTGTGGFLVGLIALVFPQVLGIGYDATDQALSQDLSLSLLIALIIAKTAATAISLAARFAGGIFSPTLYLGAMTGAAFGSIATSAFPEIASSEGLYAILGMGAVAGAVLGAPLSTTMIVFELTSGYSVTIALLLTVSIAVGLSQAVMGQSFFYWQLGKRGLFLTDGPHQSIMRRLQVKDFMLQRGDDDPEYLTKAADGKDANKAEMEPAVWLLENDNLDRALRLFAESGQSKIPVVDSNDETKLIGWADRLSALSKFNRALIDANVEEHR
ncbi:MAG: chloride channel protein [Pseudomonadota bacterium]